MKCLLAVASFLIAINLLARLGYCLNAWIRDFGLWTLPFGAYSQTAFWGGGGLVFLVAGVVTLFSPRSTRLIACGDGKIVAPSAAWRDSRPHHRP
jgi:hypothetical protein